MAEKFSWERFKALQPVAWLLTIFHQLFWFLANPATVAAGVGAVAAFFGGRVNPTVTYPIVAALLAFVGILGVAREFKLAQVPKEMALPAMPTVKFPNVDEWVKPNVAALKYCSNELREKYKMAEKAVKDAEAARTREADSYFNLMNLESARNKAADACIEDVKRQLIDGKLVAKGLKRPFSIGDDEVLIPSFQWRIMTLAWQKDAAEGDGFGYDGIVTGKPTI